jgi:hypothetical protein
MTDRSDNARFEQLTGANNKEIKPVKQFIVTVQTT